MNNFLKDYLDLTAQLNKEQQGSLLWWATDIASKNRFQSPLPELLQDKTPTPRPLAARVWAAHVLRWLWHSGRTILRVLWIKLALGRRLEAGLSENSSYDVVKSFLYLRSFGPDGAYRDAFLGPLIGHLSARAPLLVLVDIPSDFRACVKALQQAAPGTLVVPWEYFLTVKDVIHFTLKGLAFTPKPPSKLLFGREDVAHLVRPLLSYGRAKIQPYQLFHYPACLNLCRRIKVQRFILTHESNPWEKMCILALRRGAPGARIIGYQHNVVPQASANMFISPQERGLTPLPDKIIATGPEPKRVLEENGGYPPGMVEAGCALRTEALQEDFPPRGKIKNILVAMEGVDGVHALASYAIEQLKMRGDYRVVFRTHPVLPWAYFQRKYGCNLKPYNHFFLSNGQTLKNDILASDVVIYWGSTVGMESLGMGRPVIHFDNGSLLSFDPLFRCPHLKWLVKPDQSLNDTLAAIDATSDADFIRARALALEYLKEYFAPVSAQCLEKFRQ